MKHWSCMCLYYYIHTSFWSWWSGLASQGWCSPAHLEWTQSNSSTYLQKQTKWQVDKVNEGSCMQMKVSNTTAKLGSFHPKNEQKAVTKERNSLKQCATENLVSWNISMQWLILLYGTWPCSMYLTDEWHTRRVDGPQTITVVLEVVVTGCYLLHFLQDLQTSCRLEGRGQKTIHARSYYYTITINCGWFSKKKLCT